MLGENFYLQNEGCDVRSMGAQIRYRIQSVVVKLSVRKTK